MILKVLIDEYYLAHIKMVELKNQYGFRDPRVIEQSQKLEEITNVIQKLKYPKKDVS